MTLSRTRWIFIGMIAGIIAGLLLHELATRGTLTSAQIDAITQALNVVTTMFLRLVKMVIAPLVFATLTAGIARMQDLAALGRLTARTLLWFLGAGIVSLMLGMATALLLQPGHLAGIALPPADAVAPALRHSVNSLSDFAVHLVPQSLFEAMAGNEILQIVVFSVLFGMALSLTGEPARPLVTAIEVLGPVMLRVTGLVMGLAPLAIFAAMVSAIARQGVGLMALLAYFTFCYYAAIAILCAILLGLGWVVARSTMKPLLRGLPRPMIAAYATGSSEAAFSQTMELLERCGVPPRIAGFVLPLGYSFNLDGSMLYSILAVIFVAQAYGVALDAGTLAMMGLVLMVASKGIAAVPRASLVVVASALSFFHLPEGGLLLIVAIDQFCDMARAATNVVGNAVASVVVARWEGALATPQLHGDIG